MPIFTTTAMGTQTYVPSYVNDPDTDHDGLPDSIGIRWFYDSKGNYYHTVYSDPDNDIDGLSDRPEAGQFRMATGCGTGSNYGG